MSTTENAAFLDKLPLAGALTSQDKEDWPEDIRKDFEENAFNGNVGSKLLQENERTRIWEIRLAPGSGSTPTATSWTTSGLPSTPAAAASAPSTEPPASSATPRARPATTRSPKASTCSTTLKTLATPNWSSAPWSSSTAPTSPSPCKTV